MLLPAPDTSAAAWVIERWSSTFTGQLVPSGFEACATVFHPAYLEGKPVTWAELAAHFGTVAHASMTWEGVTRRRLMDGSPEPDLFDEAPGYDCLPLDLVGPVTQILRRHTATSDTCWFAWWEGVGMARERDGPKFEIPGRGYHLWSGELADAVGFTPAPVAGDHWGPSLWWPNDRAWFVGSDTDLNTTWIAGTGALVAELVASPALEAYAVSPETDFGHRL
jgi:hypothetical protein